ncbi:MAG: hypothetical protein VX498_02600, partial [Myxococcota bacterium]|nr:hypothetical protein [Myxococcota bacterium]
PPETRDIYRSRLSARDHVGSEGAPLTQARAVLLQDRVHVHSLAKRDPGDLLDGTFSEGERRAWLADQVEVQYAPGAEETILGRTPYIEVVVSEHLIQVEIIDEGEAYTAAAATEGAEKPPVTEAP